MPIAAADWQALGRHELRSPDESANPLNEADLQQWLLRHASENSLNGLIDAAPTPEESHMFIPSFPIDYLLRQRAIDSVKSILPLLGELEVISATRNISTNKTERLFPDLILFNPSEQATLIVELKVGAKTEREAVTELLAYSHEVRNHFPFSSNVDLFLVVIATDFGTLLDHAIASLLIWENKRVLCLRVIADSDRPVRLAVHLPVSWTAIGQDALPDGALQTVALVLTPQVQGELSEDDEATIVNAFEMIVREAERSGSHGFALLWHAIPPFSSWIITLGVLNPMAFLVHAIKNAFVSPDSNALTEWFASQAPGLRSDPRSLVTVGYPGRRVLAARFHTELQSFFSWPQAWQGIRDRGEVSRGDFWGLLGDFGRTLATHPATLASRGRERGASSWTDPVFVVPFLNELTGLDAFSHGRFTLLNIFSFGLSLGQLITICNTITQTDPEQLKNLPASLQWRILEFVPYVRAIAYRCESADLDGPPTLVLAGPTRVSETIESLQAYAEWFALDFLKDNEPHAWIFRSALNLHPLYDSYILCALDPTVRELCIADATSLAEGLRDLVKGATSDASDPEVVAKVEKLLRDVDAGDAAIEPSLVRWHDDPSLPTLVRAMPALIHVADSVVPRAWLPVKFPDGVGPDWEWMREQIAEARGRGVSCPGIKLSADGSVGVAILSEETALLRQLDPDTEVLLEMEGSGATIIKIARWSDVVSGAEFRDD